MRKRGWLLLVIFAMGIVSGYGIGQIERRMATAHRKKAAAPASNPGIQKLSKKLRLSKRQKESIKHIVDVKRRDLQNLQAEFRPKYIAIRETVKQDIQTVLDEQQKQQFKSMTEKAEQNLPSLQQQNNPQEPSDNSDESKSEKTNKET